MPHFLVKCIKLEKIISIDVYEITRDMRNEQMHKKKKKERVEREGGGSIEDNHTICTVLNIIK